MDLKTRTSSRPWYHDEVCPAESLVEIVYRDSTTTTVDGFPAPSAVNLVLNGRNVPEMDYGCSTIRGATC